MFYDIASEPCGDQYLALLDFAIARSDAVMLVFQTKIGSRMQSSVAKRIRKQLAPWRIKTRHDPRWPVTISYDTQYRFTIDLYAPSMELKHFLASAQHLYGWSEPGMPIDTAFFNQNECWLATNFHEKYGWLCTTDKISPLFTNCLQVLSNPNNVAFHEDY